MELRSTGGSVPGVGTGRATPAWDLAEMVIAVGSDAWEDALSPCDERGGEEKGLDGDKDSLVVSGDVLETSEMCTEDILLSFASAFVSLSLSSATALDEPRPATDFLNTNFRLGVNPARVSSNLRLSDFRTYSPPPSQRL